MRDRIIILDWDTLYWAWGKVKLSLQLRLGFLRWAWHARVYRLLCFSNRFVFSSFSATPKRVDSSHNKPLPEPRSELIKSAETQRHAHACHGIKVGEVDTLARWAHPAEQRLSACHCNSSYLRFVPPGCIIPEKDWSALVNGSAIILRTLSKQSHYNAVRWRT